MTEIIKYVADDGEEFDDEYDCRVYEWGCAISRCGVRPAERRFPEIGNRRASKL